MIARLLVTISLGCVCLSHAADPQADLQAMKVAEGYEVNLFASEIEGVVKPIQLRFDTQGRLWVVGSTVYPQIQPGEVPNDKVVVLEDTDGDGRADKSTVFADGLMIPTGIELGDGGVYVGQGTTLLHLKDTDGDGKADERRVVLRGFGTGDSHQTINSFTWSPGGELLMCQGLHALSRVETPWGIERLHSAGVWRFHPRNLRLDPFLNESMGPQNPFGVVFDRWGAAILNAGNGEGIYYLTPGMIRAPKHRTLRAMWNTGLKFGGGEFVENSHFPPDAQGQMISGAYINNSVFRFALTESGSGFEVKDLPPLITSTNLAFRIVDVRFGPDGALYLCDWYNAVIGHYQASFRHPDRDKKHGRIWRVTAKGRPLVTRPKLAGASVPELLEQLKSSERWNRQLAKRALYEVPAEQLLPAVTNWTAKLDATQADYEHQLVEALGVLESVESPEPNLLRRVLAAKDFHARAYGARVIGRWGTRLANPLELLAPIINDAHPRVRLEAVVAASYLTNATAIEVALQAVDHPLDGFIEYALAQTLHTLKPHWREPFLAGQLTFGSKSERLEYFIKTDASADTLTYVVQRLQKKDLDRTTRQNFARILAEVGGADELALLLQPGLFELNGQYDAALHAEALHALRTASAVRKVTPAGDLAVVLKPLVDSANNSVRAEAFSLAGQWKVAAFKTNVTEAANNTSAPIPLRRAALEALGQFDTESVALLKKVGQTANEPVLVKNAAIAALADHDLAQAAQLAADLFENQLDEDALRELLSILLQRKEGAAQLAKALADIEIEERNIEIALQHMSATGRRDEALAKVFTEAVGFSFEVQALKPEDMSQLVKDIREKGNAREGAGQYNRLDMNCAACHAINGKGGTIGPDLASLGTSQTIEFIIGAILQPNKEVKEGFMAIEVITKDDEEHQGYLLRENEQEVVLKDALQKTELRIRKDQIKERRQHGSLMPAGLCDTMNITEFRDLVKYLSELGKPTQ